jgi:hypothetical protein
MDQATIASGLTWGGTGAWAICFWWMHRILARQDAFLTELRELVASALTCVGHSSGSPASDHDTDADWCVRGWSPRM